MASAKQGAVAPKQTASAEASGAPWEGAQGGAAPGAPAALVAFSEASGAVALPADLAAELEAEARDAAAKERPSVGKISLRGGFMSYMGQNLPGNAMDCIVLTAGIWNKYYKDAFNPNVIVNPTCFAVASDPEAEMEPHENVENPVHESCKGCPMAEWGSDPRPNSRGKACKETRRLVVLPAAALESADALLKAEFAVVDVPVTSVRNYAGFVNTLSAAVKRPMWSVVTKLYTVPDPKTQFKLMFEPKAVINDTDLIRALRSRLEAAMLAATSPYDEAYLQGEKEDQGNGAGAPVKTDKFKG